MQRAPFPESIRSESGGPVESMLDWAASVQAFLDAHVVVPVDVFPQIPLEDIGIASLIVVKLGLERREEVFGLCVVEAVPFAGHGLDDPCPHERKSAGVYLVLSAYVRMQQTGLSAIDPVLEVYQHLRVIFMFGAWTLSRR